MEWKPIESAPKNGTPVLGFDGEEMMVVANDWNGALSKWTGWFCVAYDSTGMNPTHWMHLPAPPSADPGIPIIRTTDATDQVMNDPSVEKG